VRPSEDTRSHTLAALRRGYVSGRLHTDTFSLRVEQALTADSRVELRELAADLPHRRWRDRMRALGPARRGHGWLADPALLDTARLTLGRAEDCQLVFCDDTVSRHHARLELRDGRWFLVDLGSSNGTVVNGRRVRDAEVRAGDRVRLGGAGFTL
jgi:FHA domain-containing protein/uncharacterized protein DUF1707